MRRWFWSLYWLSATALTFVHGGASAAPAAVVAPAEGRQVQAVISAQLKALAADDAVAAFGYAAPKIRAMFGTPERFLAMVRDGYPVVYRPASVAFLVPQREGAGVMQDVHLTDAAGSLWLARYHLERQPDKSWRISGCEVVQAEGRVA